jgi:hypothetical protein
LISGRAAPISNSDLTDEPPLAVVNRLHRRGPPLFPCASPERLGTVDGQEIGSDLLDLPVGWIAAGAGALGIYALARRLRGPAIAAGVIALLVSGYTLLAIPGKETSTSNGEDVSNLVNGQVGYAWGVWAVTASAAVLLIVGTSLIRQAAVISEEPVDQPYEYDAD